MDMEWTACEEGLPDSDLTVMTYGPENDEPVWPGYHDGEQWWDITGFALPERSVTHWRPFPEPPEN